MSAEAEIIAKARTIEIEVNGQRVQVPPLGLSDLSELSKEFEADGNRAMLLAACIASQSLPASVGQMIRLDALREISQNRASPAAVLYWIQSGLDGLVASVHHAIEKQHPGKYTRADVFATFEKLYESAPEKLQALRASRDQASDLTPAEGEIASQPVATPPAAAASPPSVPPTPIIVF